MHYMNWLQLPLLLHNTEPIVVLWDRERIEPQCSHYFLVKSWMNSVYKLSMQVCMRSIIIANYPNIHV